jgi:hypothetical protein
MSSQTQRQGAERPNVLAVHKERKHVPGVVIPFLIRELISGLRPTEWVVWTICFLHANREMFCCLKHETIVAESGVGWNGVHKAKRGLIAKKWLENCGQRDLRGPNTYRVYIPIPKPVHEFIDTLWELLNRERWWNEQIGDDKHDYAEDHIDWLIAWRVIRTLKECDAALTENGRSSWKPQLAICPEFQETALKTLLDRLRKSAKSLNPDRGMWWLWGDGFEETKQ